MFEKNFLKLYCQLQPNFRIYMIGKYSNQSDHNLLAVVHMLFEQITCFYFPCNFECSKIHKELNHGGFVNQLMQQVTVNKPYE